MTIAFIEGFTKVLFKNLVSHQINLRQRITCITMYLHYFALDDVYRTIMIKSRKYSGIKKEPRKDFFFSLFTALVTKLNLIQSSYAKSWQKKHEQS